MQGSAFSIHEIQSPEHINMSQMWLLFAAEEGGCLNVVQMRIYAVIPGELAVLGDLGRDDEDLTWCLCTSAGGGDEELKQVLQNVAGQAHKHSSEVWEQKQI